MRSDSQISALVLLGGHICTDKELILICFLTDMQHNFGQIYPS